MTIKRSPGTVVTAASIPYIVGGGYEGKTKELDETVAKEAELLSKTFDRDVEIRFNSDRESGGAFLVNSISGIWGSSQVGLGAGLRAIMPEGMTRKEFIRNNDIWRNRHKLPQELYISTKADASALKDPNLANSGLEDSRYSYLHHKTMQDGLNWLIENVDKSKLLD